MKNIWLDGTTYNWLNQDSRALRRKAQTGMINGRDGLPMNASDQSDLIGQGGMQQNDGERLL